MKPIPTILLAGVLLSCSGCNSGPSRMMAGPRTVVVEIQDNSYSPASIQIDSGDTVRWVLTGATTTHTITALGGQFDSGGGGGLWRGRGFLRWAKRPNLPTDSCSAQAAMTLGPRRTKSCCKTAFLRTTQKSVASISLRGAHSRWLGHGETLP